MKPLIVMVTLNRPRETLATLAALQGTTDFRQATGFIIVDNGSDGLMSSLRDWMHYMLKQQPGANIEIVALPKNIGCPRALNLALRRYREPGQPVVKVDPDVVMVTENWIDKVQNFHSTIDEESALPPIAMVGAYYDGVLKGRSRGEIGQFEGEAVHELCPVIGHTVWHTGPFMDSVGFFDVLAPDHIYGFEDLVMSRKADLMGWKLLAWEGWRIINIQRSPTLGKAGEAEHVAKMRPLYDERLQALASGGSFYTGGDGQPVSIENGEEEK